jgi:hypothetical protein
VVERPDWKMLVMRKIDALDMENPYLDLDSFKNVLAEYCDREQAEEATLPPLKPLPAKASIAKYNISEKYVSSNSFKD